MEQPKQSFQKSMSLLDATMLVAGSMIGSGIFIVSADISRHTGSAGWMMLIWVICGFMTLTAALTYGELSAMFPKAGGQYVYLREAYNPLVSFVFGWTFLPSFKQQPLRRWVWHLLNLQHIYFLPLMKMSTCSPWGIIKFLPHRSWL